MADNSLMTTVILIRHAERENSPGNDPHLNAKGLVRAGELVRILGRAEIKAIYTSQAARTRETARPLAATLGMTPVQLDEPAALKNHILENHTGQKVLVVGHTNTVPALIGLLGTAGTFNIDDREFDNLFILTAGRTGTSSTVRLKYGS